MLGLLKAAPVLVALGLVGLGVVTANPVLMAFGLVLGGVLLTGWWLWRKLKRLKKNQ